MNDRTISIYYQTDSVEAAVQRGEHREIIGGMWDEIGSLQMDFLAANGLSPENTLLDIGCGSLRLGHRAVQYLAPGNYWGTDMNAALLDAGYGEVASHGLADKLNRSHLVTDSEFTFEGIPRVIDFAIATSVFTHLPLNHLRLCLANLAQHVQSPCTFFFTIFTPPDGLPVTRSHLQPKGGILTHPHIDPYHYTADDLQHAAAGTAWPIEFLGDWDHPRNQMMAKASKR